jgi:integrase
MSPHIPKLTRHARGLGVVRLSGVDHYSTPLRWPTGKEAPPAVLEWYERTIAEWLQRGRVVVQAKGVTVAILVRGFLKHVEKSYPERAEDGNNEIVNFRKAMERLVTFYGSLPVSQFGPKRLKTIRAAMIESQFARSYINATVRRIKQAFAWGAEEEILPGSIYHALTAVKGIRKGKLGAREAPKVRPALMSAVRRVVEIARPEIGAMVRLQLLTGMRPGEVCRITLGQVDRSRRVWVYRPERHKTEAHGVVREIFLGRRAQKGTVALVAAREG